MPLYLSRMRLHCLVGAGAVAVTLTTPAIALAATARTPTIEGHVWVAFVIIGVLVATIFLLIMGALHVERRDAAIGRRGRNDGWFGIFPQQSPDEEDAPDFHHVGDGDGGGEGS
jgi:hypothetical protein